MVLRVAISILALLTVTMSATASAKPRSAVLPLLAQGVAKQKVEILDGLLVAELDAVGRYEILGANDLNAMLGFERMRDAMGCSDVACAAEIGGALGVRYLISGSVSVLGDELIVQLTLTDVKAVAVLERGRAVVVNQDKHYRRAIELAVADLFDVTPREDTSSSPPPVEDENVPGPAFTFHTGESEREFEVNVTAGNGRHRPCPAPVTLARQCVLRGLALGDVHIAISSPPLSAFTDTVSLEEDHGFSAIEVMEIAGIGNILMWTFGGTSMVTGTALTAVGGGTDRPQMLYGGLITLGVGLGLLVWGFLIEGNVGVDYPGIDYFF